MKICSTPSLRAVIDRTRISQDFVIICFLMNYKLLQNPYNRLLTFTTNLKDYGSDTSNKSIILKINTNKIVNEDI